MRTIVTALCLVACMAACNSGANKAPQKSSSQLLFEKLKSIEGKGTLFGHQDDLAYGIGWSYQAGESDVERAAGDYPALFGWELGGLELGRQANIDKVPFDKMKEFALWAHNQGAVNTFSWHPYSAVDTTKNAWVVDHIVVEHILPGGSHHSTFLLHLDRLADFFLGLKTDTGEAIPFIFRPWHEMDGTWFWWGSSLTSPGQLQQLFRFTIEYLHSKGVSNFLTAYSPDRNFNSTEEYLSWYPGDDLVDIMGMDNYYDLGQGPEGLNKAAQKLEIVVNYAAANNKIAALTETGLDMIPDSLWYSRTLGGLINASELTRKTVYAMVWRNHDLSHFYVPHPEHPALSDFRDFTGQPNIWLLREWANHPTE